MEGGPFDAAPPPVPPPATVILYGADRHDFTLLCYAVMFLTSSPTRCRGAGSEEQGDALAQTLCLTSNNILNNKHSTKES